MNITVYLGANLGTDPALPQAVQQLGAGSAKAATRWCTAAAKAA